MAAAITALRPFAATQPQDSSAPPKYIEKAGIRHLNPDYTAYMKRREKDASTALAPTEALPIVCNMKEFEQFKGVGEATLAPTAEMTTKLLQERAVTDQVGLSSEALADQIGALCYNFDIPMGMMEKLMHLTDFDRLEFIMDDSYSMGTRSGNSTRWIEARDRLKTMIEILAYVPTPKIQISFLNNATRIVLEHKGETPENFIAHAHKQIDRAFENGQCGCTPIVETLEKSFREGRGQKVARYLFCDGQPDGGERDQKLISNMLNTRENPEGNPVTLLSCTDTDSDVDWMKVVEEVAPRCAECDDFESEAKEVLADQGPVLPYTKGFYLICQLAAAMNPDDLDALDESVPLTKSALDNLMGVVGSNGEYERYFAGFAKAQKARPIKTAVDTIKKQQEWGRYFNDFLRAKHANDIQAVRDYKEQLKKASS